MQPIRGKREQMKKIKWKASAIKEIIIKARSTSQNESCNAECTRGLNGVIRSLRSCRTKYGESQRPLQPPCSRQNPLRLHIMLTVLSSITRPLDGMRSITVMVTPSLTLL